MDNVLSQPVFDTTGRPNGLMGENLNALAVAINPCSGGARRSRHLHQPRRKPGITKARAARSAKPHLGARRSDLRVRHHGGDVCVCAVRHPRQADRRSEALSWGVSTFALVATSGVGSPDAHASGMTHDYVPAMTTMYPRPVIPDLI